MNARLFTVRKPVVFRDGIATYASVGQCIYCGAKVYDPLLPKRRLAMEHILAEGLAGGMLLPEASCAKCEGITSAFEGTCLRRIFGPIRIHLNFPTKRRKDRPETLPVFAYFHGESEPQVIEIPISDHPFICSSIPMTRPKLLRVFGDPEDEGDRKITAIFPAGRMAANTKMQKIAAKLGARRIELEARVGTDELRLLLAKTAHAMAVAMLGLENFQPFLTAAILAKDAKNLSLYVGAGRYEKDIQPGLLHHIGWNVAQRGRQYFFVAQIGLFSSLGLPLYEVVAGRLYQPPP